ncbi:MAG TPA: TIGR04376 family protein [Synechococcales cyanobacterium M55_K2018_004]|nr:TIGR04376 family protein [Synechococcales cyanobacterium M55_K2018_004]
MGLFEDLSRFLEDRLDEFLRENPHLELQALEDKLRDQEEEALRLLADLRLREKRLQDEILETAQEVQRWHQRVEKAKAAGRMDLAQPAEEREAALLRQGNQLWGQMEMLKQRIQQTIDLQRQIQAKRQEVQNKVTEAQAQRSARSSESSSQPWQTSGWATSYQFQNSADPLEQQFRRWETDQELEDLKRNMGRS